MSKVQKMQDDAVEVYTPQPVTPMEMIQTALSNGSGVEVVEKLMALQERWEASRARRAFDAAIAEARAEIPPIVKDATVDFTTAKGRTNYKHETLSGIANAVDPILARHGLSYRFRSRQEGQQLYVTCIIAHRDGYSEETTLCGPPDQSGNKNSYQAVGSAATYLQRYTLKLALGLSASNDDDAQNAAPRPDDAKAAHDAQVRRAIEIIKGESTLDGLAGYWGHLQRDDRSVAADQRVIAAKDERKSELSNADLGGDKIPY